MKKYLEKDYGGGSGEIETVKARLKSPRGPWGVKKTEERNEVMEARRSLRLVETSSGDHIHLLKSRGVPFFKIILLGDFFDKDTVFNVFFMGDESRYIKDDVMIGVELGTKVITYCERKIILELWNCKEPSVSSIVMKPLDIDGIVLFFDASVDNNFDQLVHHWLKKSSATEIRSKVFLAYISSESTGANEAIQIEKAKKFATQHSWGFLSTTPALEEIELFFSEIVSHALEIGDNEKSKRPQEGQAKKAEAKNGGGNCGRKMVEEVEKENYVEVSVMPFDLDFITCCITEGDMAFIVDKKKPSYIRVYDLIYGQESCIISVPWEIRLLTPHSFEPLVAVATPHHILVISIDVTDDEVMDFENGVIKRTANIVTQIPIKDSNKQKETTQEDLRCIQMMWKVEGETTMLVGAFNDSTIRKWKIPT